MPPWMSSVLVGALILPSLGVWLSGAQLLWLRIERTLMPMLAVITELLVLQTLGYLIVDIVRKTQGFSGHQLLATAIAAWIANVMVFSILYWQLDRGGPEARVNNVGVRPDWQFPQIDDGKETQGRWHPTYIDYLFLAFSTATAFSTTDIVPVSSRAKLLMMFESTVSLVTLVIVASRAINVLA